MKQPSVYILTNKRNGTLYVGVTSQLVKRIWEHKQKSIDSFTSRYNLSLLVYFEAHSTMRIAIQREKQLKRWKREWKVQLIETMNPTWRDLWEDLS